MYLGLNDDYEKLKNSSNINRNSNNSNTNNNIMINDKNLKNLNKISNFLNLKM